MNGKSGYKAATLLVAMVLLLGGLGLLTADLAAGQPRQIQGVVTKEGEPATLLSNVAVTLFDAHGQKAAVGTVTGADGTYTFAPGPGFYYVSVAAAGFFDNRTDTFRFDDTVNVVRDIEMEEMPAAIHSLTVHVEDDVGANLTGALVEIYNVTVDRTQLIASDLTNATTGNATFPTTLWTGDFELRVQKVGFEMDVRTLSITGDLTEIVALFPGIELVGIAREPDGSFINAGLLAYLYNNDSGVSDAKRLLVANVSGSAYTFFAYPGNYTVIVDADGKAANITSLFVHAAMTPAERRIDRVLPPSPDEEVATTIQYRMDDWNNITLWRNLTLNEDSGISGLPLSDLRHLRLQIDIVLGDGDGVLDSAEIDAFRMWLLEAGPKHVDTQDLFDTREALNGARQTYRSDLINGTTDFNVSVNIPASGSAFITGVTNYSVVGSPIAQDEPEYHVNLTGSYDTDGTVYVNFTLTLKVVRAYERTLNLTSGNVVISGYTTVLVDPLLDMGDFDAFLVLEQSLNGTARVKVIGPPSRFTELNVSQENYTAIVATEVGALLSAEDSTDPNSPGGQISPEANFTWVFTNMSQVEMGYGIEANVTFTVQGNYSGNLTIVETGGNVTFRNFTLLVDGLRPVAILENNVTGLGTNANDTNITVGEGQQVKFFGGNSTDAVHDELNGTIRQWKWDLDGDGTVDSTGKTVDWTYDEPGNFTVNLTVVDEAGHESENATLGVLVEDNTPPEVAFEVKDEQGRVVTTLMEGVRYIFDASETTDNRDALEDLAFEWSFGDETTDSGPNVSHIYDQFGTYTVMLNVTDQAGNVGNLSRDFVVEVDVPARPDLEIEPESYLITPENPEESTFFGPSIVTLRLNVSNGEDRAPAENLSVNFWAFRFGEDPGPPIDEITLRFFGPNGTETVPIIQPGDTLTIEFTWAAGSQGNYTLRVNVTDAREPDVFIGAKNSVQRQIDVRQAGFVLPLIIVAAVGVIGGIPAAIILRRRFRRGGRERITK